MVQHHWLLDLLSWISKVSMNLNRSARLFNKESKVLYLLIIVRASLSLKGRSLSFSDLTMFIAAV